MNAWAKPGIRRIRESTALLLFFLGSIASCLYPRLPPSRLAGEQAPKAWTVFSHKIHKEVLEEQRFRCTDCHLYDLAYMQRDKKINEEITKAVTRAGAQSCHFCHIEHPEKTKKALKCLECHADIRPIRPANHRAGWNSSHGPRIAQNDVDCSSCHSSRFCVKCHMRRDEADRSFHTGVALVSHPIEARADPVRCQRCHQFNWCTRCHKSGRF